MNRAALITGVGPGLGAALARRFRTRRFRSRLGRAEAGLH
mgnify:CR=1 FL=1